MISAHSLVTVKRGDSTWTGTVVIAREDGTALVQWSAPMTGRSLDFPVKDLTEVVPVMDLGVHAGDYPVVRESDASFDVLVDFTVWRFSKPFPRAKLSAAILDLACARFVRQEPAPHHRANAAAEEAQAIADEQADIADLIRRGLVCGTCADEGETSCNCWDTL